jgi:FlaA1/EpsC-like NDP-sugar epimerase
MVNQSHSYFAMCFLGLPRIAKRAIVLCVDIALCLFTLWLAYYLRLGEFVALSGAGLWAVLVSVILALPIFIISGLYRAIFRYNGWPALLAVARAVGLYGILYAAIFTAIGVPGVPRTVGIIQPILLLLFVGGSRAFVRLWLGGLYQNRFKQFNRPKVFIYGAGQTGRALAAAMHNNRELQVVGFLDDDHRLHGHILNGLRIYNPDKLLDLIAELSIQDILLAMPNMARKRRNDMLEKMRVARVSVRTLPSLTELAQGKITISDVRELDLDDLLGREPVPPNALLLRKNINQKVVLVTGAGGSIGSELCRQIVNLDPEKLLLIDQSEFALYAIHQELEAKLVAKKIILIPLLASVRDEDRMHEILSTWKPHTVYHAAAYKHVPLVEHNPAEGLKNNVLGTLKMAKAAAENDVSDFVLISTDKAVRPTNIMGGSKRMAELVLQALANQKNMKTKFTMVRFGNVLGSAGSVVPKFRQQIRAGGPVTLTHPEITRYFMTIPEAAQLVIQAGAMSAGGDVFLLEMGKPVKIMDLARRMIELSGLTVKDSQNPEGDIEIEITGLRPAEKLYEELLIGENPQPTSHPRIMKAHEDFMAWEDLEPKLNALEAALNVNDVNAIRSMIHELVPGYIPSEIVDWVHLAHDTHLS